MTQYNIGEMVQVIAAAIAVIGSIAAAFRFLGIKSRNDRMKAVREGFRAVIDSLASDNQVTKLSGAVLLRRFFNPITELGVAGTPYAQECVLVIAAILRDKEQLPEVVQKILADSLAYAPDLRTADLQRTNLQEAYLGDRIRKGINVSDADFYEANLTKSSLAGITACRTVFYKAKLEQAKLPRANLTEADFRQANLEGANLDNAELLGARFDDAALAGASFKNARNLPSSVADNLDQNGLYAS